MCFLFLSFWRSPKQEKRRKGCCKVGEKNKDQLPYVLAKEEFAFLYFILSMGNNLTCVIVRFKCIGALGSE